MSHQDQLGFYVCRYDQYDRPDFFCGWQFREIGKGEYIATWASELWPPRAPRDSVPAPCLYRTEEQAVVAAKSIIAKTFNKKVEVMQVLGGFIRFDLT